MSLALRTTMKGLVFESPVPPRPSAPNRTDVACFIGFTAPRPGAFTQGLPEDLREWLQAQGWWAPPAARLDVYPRHGKLVDVPVPIDSWERFDQLFAWNRRDFGDAGTGSTYLGAAVRSFFIQGGRRCYVVSCGSAPSSSASLTARVAAMQELVPDAGVSRSNRNAWFGLHHLFGLPEVSFVAFPDLAELACNPASTPPEDTRFGDMGDAPQPVFTECSEAEVGTPEQRRLQLHAPRGDETGYGRWRDVVHRAALWLSEHRRDAQLVAAIPMPAAGSEAAERGLFAFMRDSGWLTGRLTPGACPVGPSSIPNADNPACSIASAFVQLVYPWLESRYQRDLPGGAEPPEGVLMGLLARNALTRGTFRSLVALAPRELTDLRPLLPQSHIYGVNTGAALASGEEAPLVERVSLFGLTRDGLRLLSDVTTSNALTYRQASINRLVALVIRAARTIGEDFTFESSGEVLWARVQQRMSDVLRAMQQLGMLKGRTPGEAFQVRCDRSTMTQNDIDAGRVIVDVVVSPAANISTMRIQLVLSHGEGVSLFADAVGMA